MKYLLDTHAALWLLEGSPRLSAAARDALAAETRQSVAIAAISLLEIDYGIPCGVPRRCTSAP